MPLDSFFTTPWEQDKPELVGQTRDESYDVKVHFVKLDNGVSVGVNTVPFEQWARKYGRAYGYNPDGTKENKWDKPR